MKRLLLILLFIPFCAHSQIITTYVGTGVNGYSGDGGLGDTATLALPLGLNFDNFGNLLICQQDIVRKVDKITTIISTIAGSDTATASGGGGDGGPATCAFLFEPYAICLDTVGNYYIADRWYSEVRKVIISTGIIDTFAGNRTPVEMGNGGLAKNAELDAPVSVCFTPSQYYLYISDEFGHTVRKVDIYTDTITAFAGTGVPGFSGDGGPAVNAEFSRVLGLCSDAAGNIYIGDWDNARIRKVDATTGIVTTIAGNGTVGYSGDGGYATNAMIDRPAGMCFDKCGDLYFSMEDSNRVRRIDGVTGIITTVAGNGIQGFAGESGLAVNAELNYPVGVCIDSSGNLYIGDQGNNRVRKVTIYNPFIKITAAAGDTVCSGSQVTIQATLAGGGSIPSFQWVLNGTAMSATTSSSYSYTPANGDSISCILTSSSPCVGNPVAISNTIHFVVDSVTIPTINLAGNPAATIGSFVTVNATVAGAGSSYTIHWYDNSVLFNTTTVPTVTYTKAAGTDHITATVISTSVGCYDSTTSAVFTVTDTTTEVTSPLGRPGEVSIYPNPVDAILNVDNVPAPVSYRLLSIVGSVLLQGTLQPGNNNVSTQALSPGIYMLEISNAEGQKTITKIVKQ